MSFAQKYKIGSDGEQLLVNTLIGLGYTTARKNDNYETRYDFDVWLTDQLTTFEVKNDKMFALTGNLALEFWNSRKNEPSGISRSMADFWVHIVPVHGVDTLYIAQRTLLLAAMYEIEPIKKIKAGGDKNSDMYIFSKAQMLSEDGSTPLVKLTADVLKNFIGGPR